MNKEFSEIFYEAWKNACRNRQDNLFKNWDEKSLFTSIVLYEENSIIKEMARELSLSCYSYCRFGYYGIDAVFYEDNFKIPNTNHETWLRKIKIAFEHEKAFNIYLHTEISRLLTCNAELKVLVTYPSSGKKKNEVLNYLQSLMIDVDDCILIILGIKNGNDIIWDKFILSNKGITE
jgi:hypothetical protein